MKLDYAGRNDQNDYRKHRKTSQPVTGHQKGGDNRRNAGAGQRRKPMMNRSHNQTSHSTEVHGSPDISSTGLGQSTDHNSNMDGNETSLDNLYPIAKREMMSHSHYN